MVAARIPSCSVSVITRSTNFSPPIVEAAPVAGASLGEAVAGALLGALAGPADVAGELAVPGAELAPGFAARPAACLHPSDSESLCSLRQATMRPPPGCTPAHSFWASSAQAARIAASDG